MNKINQFKSSVILFWEFNSAKHLYDTPIVKILVNRSNSVNTTMGLQLRGLVKFVIFF